VSKPSLSGRDRFSTFFPPWHSLLWAMQMGNEERAAERQEKGLALVDRMY